MNAPAPILGDVLQPGLRVVFCGTALGHTSARLKAYYAHPRNLFWTVLHEVGLTSESEPLPPAAYRRAVEFGIGLTDLCKFESGNDNQLSRHAFDRDALRDKVLLYKPSVLAFTSKKGGRAFCGASAELGWQTGTIGETRIYVLPSTSPAARWQWDRHKAHWQILAESLKVAEV